MKQRGGRTSKAAAKRKRFRRFGDRPKMLTRIDQAVILFDYKNVPQLQRVTTQQGKLYSRKRAANTAASQRVLKQQVKYARFLALLPYVG